MQPELEAVTIYVTIYMPLLDEGTDVWAPVEAEDLKSGRYRIVGATPEDQQWDGLCCSMRSKDFRER